MTSYDQIDGGHDDLFPIFLHSQLLLSALISQMQLQLQQKQQDGKTPQLDRSGSPISHIFNM